MSFVDRKQDPRRRANAIVAVGLIHAGLAYVVVTGLGAEIVKQWAPPPVRATQVPLPPPPPDPTPPKPRRRPGRITNNDYPRRALVDEAEGSVAYRLVIGTNGRVSSCELTRPSGNSALDDATCRLIARRARFEPATDETGAKVLGTFTGSVQWQIPE